MEAREFLGEMGHGIGGTTFTTAGIEGVAFIFRFDQTAEAVSRVVAVIDQDGMFRGGVIFGVEPGIADGVINVAIVIDIASGDAVPPAEMICESSGLGRFGEDSFFVEEKFDRSPFMSDEEV